MSFKAGVFSTFFSKVLASVLGLLMVVAVSRLLGAEGRGHISLYISSVAFLQLFCDFGNSSALINLSYTHSQRRLWFSSLLWILLVCIVSYALLLIFPNLPYVWLIPPAAFLYSVINLQQMLLMGCRKVHLRNLSLLVSPALILPVFLLLYTRTELGNVAYPAALFISLSVSALVSWLFLQRHGSRGDADFRFEPGILSSGVWVQSAQLIQFLNYRLNFFVLAAYAGESALGIYNNAVVLAESVWIVGHSIGQMQHMSILNSDSHRHHVALSRRMMLYSFSASAVLCVFLYLIPDAFWTYLFSKDFSGLRDILIWLIPGVLCFSLSNIIIHFFHARGLFRQIVLCNAFGLLCGGLLAWWLIPVFGLKGAALSWSAGLAASMLFYLYRFKIISQGLSENR